MHNKKYGNVVFVTGAMSGVGRFVADRLMDKGYRVYGTSRKIKTGESNSKLIQNQASGGFLCLINMDVCSDESVSAAVQYVIKQEGRIDILVNNAGIVTAGSVEDTTYEEALKQFDVNFFGTHRMCRYILPIMRHNNNGLIINISSVAGFIALPFQSMYCSSKSALEAMSESLRMELKPFGINVVIIEPGDMKTGNTDGRIFAAASIESIYKARFKKSISVMERDERNGPEPVSVADTVEWLVRIKNPPVRVTTTGIQYKLFRFLKRILPDRLISYVVAKIY